MSRCMVLNASYEFLAIEEHWIDALGLVLSGKAVPLEEYPDVVRSQHCTFRLPAVVLMRYQVKTLRRRQVFNVPTRKAVFIRDGFACQYCGTRVSMTTGTRDHVIPRSRGGPDIMQNVVTACRACNVRKDDRMLEEVGMSLTSRPRPLTEEEKIQCLIKLVRAKERNAWMGCLRRLGLGLWAA
jgi:5-methylcytosine-specific restriction endonuclease McrA